jgi:hypothetical protein
MDAHVTVVGCTSRPMVGRRRAVETAGMDSMLIYCRPRDGKRAETLAAWLEHEAAALAARPGIRRTAVVRLTTPRADDGCDRGWLLDCEVVDPAGPPDDAFRELLTDMRLVGFDPIIFVSQPQPA